jgi:hypothetical protein
VENMKEDLSQYYTGVDFNQLFNFPHMALLTLIKTIMLEGRIVIFSQVSSKVSSFVYSLLALLPGLSYFNNHKGGPLPLSVLKSLRFLSQYGLPL